MIEFSYSQLIAFAILIIFAGFAIWCFLKYSRDIEITYYHEGEGKAKTGKEE